MLTREQIKQAVAGGRESVAIDERDYERLVAFFPVEDLEVFGYTLKPGAEWSAKDLTHANVLAQLKGDLAFAFEKALSQRGLSAHAMWAVVSMWMWVLEDELADVAEQNYEQYGLPFLKMVAVKYGFPNPIGDDCGSEDKYASD